MTEAEKAYEAAERLIAEVIESGAKDLNFSKPKFRAMPIIPPGIAEARNVERVNLGETAIKSLENLETILPNLDYLNLSWTEIDSIEALRGSKRLSTFFAASTKIYDLDPIRGHDGMRSLDLRNSLVSDLSPIDLFGQLRFLTLTNAPISEIGPLSGKTNLSRCYLGGTRVTDLRPILQSRMLVDKPEFDGLLFDNTPACSADEEIDRISKIEDPSHRASALFAYLEHWVPKGERRTKSTNEPLTVEALLEQQDQMGWRFSAGKQGFELFVVGGDLDETQQKYANQAARRLCKLIEKLQSGNCYGFRQDILDEALEFLGNLENQDEPLSEQALDLWASLIAMGTMLEANDTAKKEGRDPFDLLKVDERAALQTFMSVASNLVRSFPDTKDLDEAQLRFNRTEASAEAILHVIQEALAQNVLQKESGTLVNDVAKLSEEDGTQGDKAKSVTANGAKNLVTAAAIVATATGGGLLAGVTGDVGGDLSDHYELGEKSARYLDSLGEKLMDLIEGMPPDERANLISILEDMRDTRQRRKDEEDDEENQR